MNLSGTMRQQRDQFVAHRNRFSARWTSGVRVAPASTGSNAPGDGVSDRENDAGHWGSAAGDGSAPDVAGTETDDPAHTPPRRPAPLTPGASVNRPPRSSAG
jgi:hypothetical protein